VLDQQHGDVARQAGDAGRAISWRSLSGTPAAGSSSSSTRGLVAMATRDLEQALLAIGQRRVRLIMTSSR
jgi:hypothetical protein